MFKRLFFALLFSIVAGGAAAQDEAGEITLVPFTDASAGVTGVVPSDWEQVQPGLWQRPTGNLTRLVQQGIVASLNDVVPELLGEIGLTTLPDPIGLITANGLDWVLYEALGPETTNAVIDLALTTKGASVYIVEMLSTVEERDALRERIFLPAVEALTPFDPPPAVPEDASYSAENVDFNNGAITLAGTLTLPEGAGPHPAIVLISGSGPQDRDETLAGMAFAPFAAIADHLTRAGIAVLRYDDRGYGRSGGNFLGATTADFAGDAAAAIAFLRTRPEVDPAQIGVLGHSEGAAAAAHLAEQGVDVAYYVLMAGPAVSGYELLLFQSESIYASRGLAPEVAAEQAAAQRVFVEAMYPLILSGDLNAMQPVLEARIREEIATLTEEQRAGITDIDAAVAQIAASTIPQYTSAWWPYFMAYDPAAGWAETDAPVLAIYGGLDVQVDAEGNAAALEAALEAGGNEDFEIVTLPEANHLFQQAATGSELEYALLQPRFIDAFLPTMTEWILARVTLAED